MMLTQQLSHLQFSDCVLIVKQHRTILCSDIYMLDDVYVYVNVHICNTQIVFIYACSLATLTCFIISKNELIINKLSYRIMVMFAFQ